jgi:hypothetical protein
MAFFRGRAFFVIAGLVVIVLLVLIFHFVPLSTLRDLAIILIALLDVVLLALMIAIAFGIWKLVDLLRGGLPPILGSVSRTATTIEGTADFVTTTAVTPLIRGTSLVYAATRFLQVLFSRRREK